MLPPVTSWVVPSFLRRTTLPVTSFFLPFLPQPPAATGTRHGVFLPTVSKAQVAREWVQKGEKTTSPSSTTRRERRVRFLGSVGAHQSDPRISPPSGVMAACQVLWERLELTSRTLPSPIPTWMPELEKPWTRFGLH